MSNEFRQIVERIRSAGSLLLLTHVHPDGDGLGSMVALTHAARAAGVSALPMIEEWVPWRYKFLFEPLGEDAWSFTPAFDTLSRQADQIVVLDTSSRSQLGQLAEKLDTLRYKTVVIDHHSSADDLGAVCWLDTSAAAVGVMTLELLEALAWPIDGPIAEALATAIVSDTGWLRFSNTSPRCLRAVAKLIEAGVAMDELYRRIYQNDRPERLRLLARMLESLELHATGRLAVMAIRRGDFAETGARADETESLVNEAMRLAGVEMVILLTEAPDPTAPDAEQIRVSLRSRREVDVAKLAEAFGGGGHARAAGLRVTGRLDDIQTRLIAAATDALEKNRDFSD